MNKRNLQNGRLDEMGRELLKAMSLPGEELERIVSAPSLFDGVKARIKAEQATHSESISGGRSVFSFWNWQSGAAAFAGLAIVAFAIVGLFNFRGQNKQAEVARNAPAQVKSAEPVRPQYTATDKTTTAVAREPEEADFKNSTLIYQESAKNKPATPVLVNKRTQRQQPDTQTEPEDEFYPLAFNGNKEDIASGAQVVRVDLPRSSLFAMGVDMPAGNGSETVKADLLISSDGVARGVRFVK